MNLRQLIQQVKLKTPSNMNPMEIELCIAASEGDESFTHSEVKLKDDGDGLYIAMGSGK